MDDSPSAPFPQRENFAPPRLSQWLSRARHQQQQQQQPQQQPLQEEREQVLLQREEKAGADMEKVYPSNDQTTTLTIQPLFPCHSLHQTTRPSSCPLPDSPAHLHYPTTKLMSQYAYGSIPDSEPAEVADGDQPQHPSELIEEGCFPEARHRIGKVLESKRAHMAILGLTVFDILLVILQIGASLLHLDETKEELWVLKLFEHLSLAIVSFFVLEILLKLFTFGPKYFWKGTHHGILHLIDAVIIFISFFLEVFVKSTEALELGSLLIIFRLWRIVKLTGTVAIEVNEQDGYKIKDLQLRVRQLEQQLEESQAEVTRLRQFTQDQV